MGMSKEEIPSSAFVVPKTITEAMARLEECDRAMENIACQLEVNQADSGWRSRAGSAMSGYKQERKRMQTCIAVFKGLPPDPAVKERDEAREACRRLAEEVEALTARLAAAPSGIDRAFVECASIVLSEVTFNRILARARERGVM